MGLEPRALVPFYIRPHDLASSPIRHDAFVILQGVLIFPNDTLFKLRVPTILRVTRAELHIRVANDASRGGEWPIDHQDGPEKGHHHEHSVQWLA